MSNRNFNIIMKFLLFILIYCNNWLLTKSEQTSNVDTFRSFKNDSTSSDCYKPRDTLAHHSCEDVKYPTNKVKCRCASHYDLFVEYVCDNQWWYRKPSTTCLADNGKSYVDLADYLDNPEGQTCRLPEEQVNKFHSCTITNGTVGAYKLATCSCTYNYNGRQNLACYKGYWYRHTLATPCNYTLKPNEVRCFKSPVTGAITCNCIKNCLSINVKKQPSESEIEALCNKAVNFDQPICHNGEWDFGIELFAKEKEADVYVNTFKDGQRGVCDKPKENVVNVFHSCSDVTYPKSKTSCVCAVNADQKISLICNDGKWYRATKDFPCESLKSTFNVFQIFIMVISIVLLILVKALFCGLFFVFIQIKKSQNQVNSDEQPAQMDVSLAVPEYLNIASTSAVTIKPNSDVAFTKVDAREASPEYHYIDVNAI